MMSILREAIINSNFSFFQLISYFMSAVAVIFICTPIHEYAHAITAVKLGDSTPKYTGRTTINPLAHIDWTGALLILLFGFGWAKPVQVNSYNFKKPKRDMAITALAGPVSNVILGFIFYVFYKLLFLLPFSNVTMFIIMFCIYAVQINISLAVFNLIPIPPLDGSRLLSACLSDRNYYRLMQYERYFFLIIILLLFTGVLDTPIQYLQSAVYKFFDLLTFWI